MSLMEQVTAELARPDRINVRLGELVQHVISSRTEEDLCFNVTSVSSLNMESFKEKHGERWLDHIQQFGAVFKLQSKQMIEGVGPHMATLTASVNDVSLVSWDMPMGEGRPDFRIHTVLVKSTGEAEEFGMDPLMEEFTQYHAGRSVRAHAFHFFRRSKARIFRKALRDTIMCINFYYH